MSNHAPLTCGVLAGEQCDLAGVPGDHEQSGAVVMGAGASYRASRVLEASRCRPPLGARLRLAALYGVIAMETGATPTLIALPAVLVAAPIGVTVPEPLLTT